MLKSLELATQTSCLNRAADDEPIFVLRANDENAPGAVIGWTRDYIYDKGGWDKLTELQKKKVEEATQLAGQMRIYKMQQRKAGK